MRHVFSGGSLQVFHPFQLFREGTPPTQIRQDGFADMCEAGDSKIFKLVQNGSFWTAEAD